MELGVYVPVRVWVGRSSGSYDAHSFHHPMLHNQRVSPAVVLLQGCWPVTEPVPEILAGLLPSRRYVCSLWAKISGVGTNRAGNSGRGLRGAAAAGCGHRKSAVAEAIVRLESLALGRVRQGEQRRPPAASRRAGRSPGRELAGYANAVQLGRLPRPVSRIEAISKQFATNSRNSLLFGRSAVRLLPRRP
jgi:hypothetical protein